MGATEKWELFSGKVTNCRVVGVSSVCWGNTVATPMRQRRTDRLRPDPPGRPDRPRQPTSKDSTWAFTWTARRGPALRLAVSECERRR